MNPTSIEREEPLGTKEKFWFLWGGTKWLFKYRRAETGEDWAERIAAELAQRLFIPHAEVELASYGGQRGIVTCNFTVGGMHPLVHGNDMLVAHDPAYPHQSFFKVREHTVDAIAHVLERVWWTEENNAEPSQGKGREPQKHGSPSSIACRRTSFGNPLMPSPLK